jgi:hypothetical protein
MLRNLKFQPKFEILPVIIAYYHLVYVQDFQPLQIQFLIRNIVPSVV